MSWAQGTGFGVHRHNNTKQYQPLSQPDQSGHHATNAVPATTTPATLLGFYSYRVQRLLYIVKHALCPLFLSIGLGFNESLHQDPDRRESIKTVKDRFI